MSGDLKAWLVRLPAIVSLAALMGWLGLFLMYLGTPFFPGLDNFWTRYVLLASITIWGPASFLLRERQLRTWLTFGAISPLLGAILVAPPASFAFVIVKAYIAFPIGFTTGMLMYWIVCEANRHNKRMQKSGDCVQRCGWSTCRRPPTLHHMFPSLRTLPPAPRPVSQANPNQFGESPSIVRYACANLSVCARESCATPYPRSQLPLPLISPRNNRTGWLL